MDRIKASQTIARSQRRSTIEQFGAKQDLVEPGELSTGTFNSWSPTSEDGSYHLDTGEGARHELVGAVPAQESSQGIRLSFSLDELHQR